jgi:hypothetical protein
LVKTDVAKQKAPKIKSKEDELMKELLPMVQEFLTVSKHPESPFRSKLIPSPVKARGTPIRPPGSTFGLNSKLDDSALSTDEESEWVYDIYAIEEDTTMAQISGYYGRV